MSFSCKEILGLSVLGRFFVEILVFVILDFFKEGKGSSNLTMPLVLGLGLGLGNKGLDTGNLGLESCGIPKQTPCS